MSSVLRTPIPSLDRARTTTLAVVVSSVPNDLDEQFCFALHAASRAVTGLYREGLAALGITYTQYLVLLVLWDGDGVPMGELGRRLAMDSATLSPVVKRLEGRGLLTRRRDPDDERRVVVTATPASRELQPAVRTVQLEVQDALGVRADQLFGLRDELTSLTARLHATQSGS